MTLPGYDPARDGAPLRVSAHFAAHHPAFRSLREGGACAAGPAPAVVAASPSDGEGEGGSYETVLRLNPEWAAKLRGTVERLAARDGPSKNQRRKMNKKKRKGRGTRGEAAAADDAPPAAPAVDVDALAAAARAYAAARGPPPPEPVEARRAEILSWLAE